MCRKFTSRLSFSISGNKSQHLNAFRVVLQSSLPNPLKPEIIKNCIITEVRLVLEVWRYASASFRAICFYIFKDWRLSCSNDSLVSFFHDISSHHVVSHKSIANPLCGFKHFFATLKRMECAWLNKFTWWSIYIEHTWLHFKSGIFLALQQSVNFSRYTSNIIR